MSNPPSPVQSRIDLPRLRRQIWIVAAAFAGSVQLAATCTANAEIVFNELMYHPAGAPEMLVEEFIELTNTGEESVDVSGWKIDRGIAFTIPPDISIGPGGFLVLAASRDGLLARSPEATNIVEGGWSGKLSNSGERVRLVNVADETIDEIRYSDEGDWAARRPGPVLAGTRGWTWQAGHDGTGFSIELIDKLTRNDRGQNWGTSVANTGTPGMPNSIASDEIAPLISSVQHSPALPTPTESVTIKAKIEDRGSTPLTVSVRYRVADLSTGGTQTTRQFESAPMHDDGDHNDDATTDGTFATILPPQPDGTVIDFYIEASDGTLTRTWPGPSDSDDQQRANALYRVQSSENRESSSDAVYLVMTPDENRTFSNINRSSNALMNTSVIWTRENGETDVRYQCGVRVRGNSSRRNNPHPIRLTLPGDEPLNKRTEFNINASYSYLQVLGMHVFSQAGMAAPDARPVQLFYNGQNRATRASPMFGHYALLEPLGDEFLDRELPDSSGNLYKKRSANPRRDRKRWGVHFESTVVYENPNWYRTDRWEKQTNVTENDWSDLQRFVEIMHATPDETFLSEADKVVNRSQWLRWFAIMTIFNNRETNLSNGIDDDYSMYRSTEDPRFILLPHDFDSIFNRGADATETIYPMIERVAGVSGADEIPQLIRYMRSPEIEREYFAHMQQLLTTVLTPERFSETVDQLIGPWVSSGTVTAVKRALQRRREFVMNAIALKPVTVSWSGESTGEFPSTEAATVGLTGEMDSNSHARITIAGIDATSDQTGDNWSIESVPLFPGINRIPIVGYASDGTEVDSTFIDVWRTDREGTILTGAIDADRTLIPEDGPYVLSGIVSVSSDVTLTVSPGTSLFFEPGARLEIQGALRAEGTPDQRIRFTSVPGAELVEDIRPELPLSPPHWAGIHFNKTISTENIIRHADIEYAQTPRGAVYLESAQALIDHCTFRGSRLRYVHAVSSSATISNCVFPDMFLPDEEPHDLKLDNVSEHIKSTGAFPAGGHFLIQGNTFGTNAGHNDVIDVNSGSRSDEQRQILRVLNNIFSGARDELLDLGGDVYVDGNFFRNVFKDNKTSDRGYANAISSGDSGTNTTIVTTRNVFWDVDHAINLKRSAAAVFENNTVVNVHEDFVDNFGFTNIGSAINLYVDEPGGTAARGASASGNLFFNVPRVFGNADLPADTTSILAINHSVITPELAAVQIADREESLLDLGSGNIIIDDPSFLDPDGGDFRLRSGSVARGAAALGQDAGAFVGSGIFIAGEPDAVTDSTTATLTVGGPGLFSFQYRVNDGEWSEELPIGDQIGFDRTAPDNRTAKVSLTDLSVGTWQVSVRGRDFSGEWQTEPTLSQPWDVRPLEHHERVRINEVLAINQSAFDVAGVYPDAIELKNVSSGPVDISGMGISDNPDNPTKFLFAPGTVIPADDFLVVSAGSIGGETIPATDFGLSGSGDAVYLFAADGTLVDSIAFGYQATDFSIGRYDSHWAVSVPTLGAANRQSTTADARSVRINEWLAGASNRFGNDYVELLNTVEFPIALDRLRLTDDVAYEPDKFIFPALSFITPNGFLALDQSDLNFSLARDSEDVALLDSNRELIDGISIVNAAGDGAYGRMPDGATDFQLLPIASPGQPNDTPTPSVLELLASLRITEILFSPEGAASHEFVELRNVGATSLDLEGVQFTKGIGFTFGADTLDPGEFIVVAQDADTFTARYGIGVRLAGTFTGRLNNGGETLELSLPDPSGVPIQRFRYEGDWFSLTSTGRSIEFVEDLLGDTTLWSERGSWLPSTNRLGSPGNSGAPVVVNLAASTFVDDMLALPIIARNNVTSYRANGLPPGLRIDRTTGLITGQTTTSGIFDVTLTANGPGGQRNGTLSLYVSAFGPFHELRWGELGTRYSISGDPVPLALQAADASGRTVANFADLVSVEATQLDTPDSYVVISEILDTSAKDAIELVNVSGRPLPTGSWKIAVNDAAIGIEAVHSALQTFPTVLETGAVITFDDVPDSGTYFGTDIPWDVDRGWVMISDGNGTVLDFVPWGYSVEELRNLTVTVDGIVHAPGLLWNNRGLVLPGESHSLQRTGDSNRYDPSQWIIETPTFGSLSQFLVPTFASTIPLDLVSGEALPFSGGLWSESIVSPLPFYGAHLTATTPGQTVVSSQFSVTPSTSPVVASIGSLTTVEGQPFKLLRSTTPSDGAIIFTSKALPAGLILDPSTGSISGSSPVAGSHAFTLIGQNLIGETAIEVQLLSLEDSDGDGAPDIWENNNGFDTELVDAHTDPDSDGATNLDEYHAGTDPRDANSVFRINTLTYNIATGLVQLEWRSVIGRNYAIETSGDLRSWSLVPDGRVTAATETSSHLFFESGLVTRHYRVRVLP